MTWCDVCGDIVAVYKPIEVKFPDRSTIIINICIGCWYDHFEGKSRKLKVARLLTILLEGEMNDAKGFGWKVSGTSR